MINKIKISYSKYQTLITYIFVAGTSFALDILLFSIFNLIISNSGLSKFSILISTIIARIFSSFYNYLMNKNIVFKTKTKLLYDKDTLSKYYILVLIQMNISAALVSILKDLIKLNATIIKIPVDIFIFIINYIIQKKYIFRNEESKNV